MTRRISPCVRREPARSQGRIVQDQGCHIFWNPIRVGRLRRICGFRRRNLGCSEPPSPRGQAGMRVGLAVGPAVGLCRTSADWLEPGKPEPPRPEPGPFKAPRQRRHPPRPGAGRSTASPSGCGVACIAVGSGFPAHGKSRGLACPGDWRHSLAVKPCWCYSNPWDAPPARLPPTLPGALNSAVECHLHTVEVAGSNPAAPTINNLLPVT